MNNPNQPPFQAQASPNIILAVISLALGVIGLFGMIPTLIFTLCSVIPIGFGIAALIMGILAKVRARSDPANWGGGGLAIAGAVAGVFCIVAPVLYFIIVMVLWFGFAAMSNSGR